MNDQEKMKIAQDFIAQHNEMFRLDWSWDYLETYADLVGGVYGEVCEELGMNTIEISKVCSKSGNPIIFQFEIEEE